MENYILVEYSESKNMDGEFYGIIEEVKWGLRFKTVEDVHAIAKMLDMKIYGIDVIQSDGRDFFHFDRKRVFVSLEVLGWERILKNRKEAKLNLQAKALEKLAELPYNVDLYKDATIHIVGCRHDPEGKVIHDHDKFHGMALVADHEIHLENFFTKGFSVKPRLLKRQFANAMYKRLDLDSKNLSYYAEKVTCQNMPKDIYNKYVSILETAVAELKMWNDKVQNIRNFAQGY